MLKLKNMLFLIPVSFITTKNNFKKVNIISMCISIDLEHNISSSLFNNIPFPFSSFLLLITQPS